MKIVINNCFGGFNLSQKAEELYAYKKGLKSPRCTRNLARNNKTLIEVVEELGSEAASGSCAELKIVEIPDGVSWRIEEYDGAEHIAESHRTWC